MGYSDLATVDAARACIFASEKPKETIDNLVTFYLTDLSNQETTTRQMNLLRAETGYTLAQMLTTAPDTLSQFIFALQQLKIVRDGNPNDTTYQEKARQLEERIKNDYRKALELQKKLNAKGESFGLYSDISTKIIYKPGMHSGRYPWDEANKRNLAVQTEEGIQAMIKKFNKVIESLNASKVEVRFLPHGVQSAKSEKKGGRPEIAELQFGMFSKHRIGANETVLRERPYLSVNNRSHSRCEHCGELCSSLAQHYKCSRCTTVVYCSEKCRDDADSMYHKFLCGRESNLRSIYKDIQQCSTGNALTPLVIIKLFAMSIQSSIPVLELPGIQILHAWTPSLADGNSYLIYNYYRHFYQSIMEALDIEPKRWVEFDFWVFETLYRIKT